MNTVRGFLITVAAQRAKTHFLLYIEVLSTSMLIPQQALPLSTLRP